MKILALVLLLVANFLHSLLNHLLGSKQHREMVLNVHKDNERIANLNVVLGAQARDNRFGDFKVPLVADVAEVLKPDVIVCVGALKGRSFN